MAPCRRRPFAAGGFASCRQMPLPCTPPGLQAPAQRDRMTKYGSLAEALQAACEKQGKAAGEVKELNLDGTCRAPAVEVRPLAVLTRPGSTAAAGGCKGMCMFGKARCWRSTVPARCSCRLLRLVNPAQRPPAGGRPALAAGPACTACQAHTSCAAAARCRLCGDPGTAASADILLLACWARGRSSKALLHTTAGPGGFHLAREAESG